MKSSIKVPLELAIYKYFDHLESKDVLLGKILYVSFK